MRHLTNISLSLLFGFIGASLAIHLLSIPSIEAAKKDIDTGTIRAEHIIVSGDIQVNSQSDGLSKLLVLKNRVGDYMEVTSLTSSASTPRQFSGAPPTISLTLGSSSSIGPHGVMNTDGVGFAGLLPPNDHSNGPISAYAGLSPTAGARIGYGNPGNGSCGKLDSFGVHTDSTPCQ